MTTTGATPAAAAATTTTTAAATEAAATESPLEELARALRVVARGAARTRLHEHLLEVGSIQLDRAGFGMLATVAELAPVRVSDLAHHRAVEVSTASRQVGRLEHDGLVRRVADAQDGRVCRLEVTPPGRHALERMRVAWQRTLEEVLSDWPARDRECFTVLLRRFGDDLTLYSERL
ncbi:MAG: MarR family winged helix-turn-helix transcriptional regulator [Solirubrobacteraceae bacterium]